jgi:hypothetical protein
VRVDDLDGKLDDLRWKERAGDSAEQVFREALRRAVALRDGGSPNRAVVLVSVLNRLGELSRFDTADLWTRD